MIPSGAHFAGLLRFIRQYIYDNSSTIPPNQVPSVCHPAQRHIKVDISDKLYSQYPIILLLFFNMQAPRPACYAQPHIQYVRKQMLQFFALTTGGQWTLMIVNTLRSDVCTSLAQIQWMFSGEVKYSEWLLECMT